MKKYKLLTIRTKVGDKLGYRSDNSVKEISEILSRAREIDGDKIIIIPDILYPYKDEILNIARKYENTDLVIIVGKNKSFIARLFGRLIHNPLASLTKNKLSITAIISKNILMDEKIKSFNDIIDKAKHVVEIVYDVPLHIYTYMLYGRLPSKILLAVLEPIRIIKFALVGLSGFFINYLTVAQVLSLLTTYSILYQTTSHFIASIMGFETSLTWNFILHELWTFRDLKLSKGLFARIKRWLKYHVASIGSLITQTTSVTILSGIIGAPLLYSVAIGVMLGFIVNYMIGRFYTWSEK